MRAGRGVSVLWELGHMRGGGGEVGGGRGHACRLLISTTVVTNTFWIVLLRWGGWGLDEVNLWKINFVLKHNLDIICVIWDIHKYLYGYGLVFSCHIQIQTKWKSYHALCISFIVHNYSELNLYSTKIRRNSNFAKLGHGQCLTCKLKKNLNIKASNLSVRT